MPYTEINMNIKILIVEDEEALAKVLEEKFQNEEFKTAIARNGEAVLPLAKSFQPDIVILDLILPKKHGLEVLKELKSDAELKTIPVIVLSNLEGDEDIKKALSLGAADYFVKTQHPLKEIVEKVRMRLINPKAS